MKTLILSALFIVGCQNTPATQTNPETTQTVTAPVNEALIVDKMFQSYQQEVYQECNRMDRNNCYGWSKFCVSELRQGQGKFSCGNGIVPAWIPFHRAHLAEEKTLDCIGKGDTLASCKGKFGNLHTASPTALYNKCIESYMGNGNNPCANWQAVFHYANDTVCDKCTDRCFNQGADPACERACEKTWACQEIPSYKTEQQCIADMVEKSCHNRVNYCAHGNNDVNDECLTNE